MARTAQTLGKSTLILIAGGAMALAITSCSSNSEPPPPAPSTSASPSVSGVPLNFDVTVSSVISRDGSVGDNDSEVYGVQVMEGRTTVNDKSIKARLMYTMDYTDGSGPINGFLELEWSDGSKIGTRLVDGKGTADDKGNTTELEAMLTVINGSEKAAGVSGGGQLTGVKSSSSSSSSSLKLSVELNLVGAPNDFTGEQESKSPSSSSSGSASGSGSESPSMTKTPSESVTATITP